MTRVKGTALAIAFAPDQRTNIENDLAIAYSIASRLKGSFHPRSNAAICIFPSITDCLQSATAAVNWFTQTEGGLNGVGTTPLRGISPRAYRLPARVHRWKVAVDWSQ